MKHELIITSLPSFFRIKGKCSCNKVWWSYKTDDRTKKEAIDELKADHKRHIAEAQGEKQ